MYVLHVFPYKSSSRNEDMFYGPFPSNEAAEAHKDDVFGKMDDDNWHRFTYRIAPMIAG